MTDKTYIDIPLYMHQLQSVRYSVCMYIYILPTVLLPCWRAPRKNYTRVVLMYLVFFPYFVPYRVALRDFEVASPLIRSESGKKRQTAGLDQALDWRLFVPKLIWHSYSIILT